MDFDLDSVMFCLSVLNLLKLFKNLAVINLCNTKHLEKELDGFILLGEMGWRFFAIISDEMKKNICAIISQQGPLVVPSRNSDTFICGRVLISIRLLTMALYQSGVRQVVILGYGLKWNDEIIMKFGSVSPPSHPVISNLWDFGVKRNCDDIPMFSIDKKYGRTYPMLNRSEEGSVEVKYRENIGIVRCIVYQELIHAIKALKNVQICIPRTNKSYRNKIVALISMFKDLKDVNEDYLFGYRVEIRIRGISSIYDAFEMAEDFFNSCDLPPHVRIVRTLTIDDFFKTIRDAINVFRRFTIGRNQQTPNQQAKHLLARLYNAFGFSIGKWLSYLRKPAYPDRETRRGSHRITSTSRNNSEVDAAKKMLKTRSHPKKPGTVCAMMSRGGCTKTFDTIAELADFVVDKYPSNWRFMYLLKKQGKVQNTNSNYSLLQDLPPKFTYDGMMYDGNDSYLVVDVPNDHHCLFHALEGIFSKAYTSAGPKEDEIRRGIISFYETCNPQLREYLEGSWPGVMTFAERATILREKENEWGEHMDIIAASCFFNVEITVMTQQSNGRYTKEIIKPLRRDGSPMRSYLTSPRVLMFNGKNHYYLAHLL